MIIERITIWPFFTIAGFGVILGAILVTFNWPKSIPDFQDLRKFSGDVARVTVRDDISGTISTMKTPIESVYFQLEGIDGEFRYPAGLPKFMIVRDSTGVSLEIWVDAAKVGSGQPMLIYQLREYNPLKRAISDDAASLETFVSYREIVSSLTRVRSSYFTLGMRIVALSIVVLIVGIALHRFKHRRARHGENGP